MFRHLALESLFANPCKHGCVHGKGAGHFPLWISVSRCHGILETESLGLDHSQPSASVRGNMQIGEKVVVASLETLIVLLSNLLGAFPPLSEHGVDMSAAVRIIFLKFLRIGGLNSGPCQSVSQIVLFCS